MGGIWQVSQFPIPENGSSSEHVPFMYSWAAWGSHQIRFPSLVSSHGRMVLGDGGPLRDDMPVPALANVQLVIWNFADPDETSAERLCQEGAKNHVDQVEMLLQKPQDSDGRGPMGCRAPIIWTRLEVVPLPIEARADMNVAAGGMTALNMAAQHGFLEVVRCLV